MSIETPQGVIRAASHMVAHTIMQFGPCRDMYEDVERNAIGNCHYHDEHYQGCSTIIDGVRLNNLGPIEKYYFDNAVAEIGSLPFEQACLAAALEKNPGLLLFILYPLLKNSSVRSVTMDLMFRVEKPFGCISHLVFGFETIVTTHRHNQVDFGHATDMAYENEDKVDAFFKKLEFKLGQSRSQAVADEFWRKTGTCRSRDR